MGNLKLDPKRDITTAVQHIHSRDSEALPRLARHAAEPGKIHWKKILVRLAIIAVTFLLMQIPALGETMTGIGALLVPETELGGLGLGLILAWRLGPAVDRWLGIND
jgi:hypothetical protein